MIQAVIQCDLCEERQEIPIRAKQNELGVFVSIPKRHVFLENWKRAYIDEKHFLVCSKCIKKMDAIDKE